jgi:hypothetical protein
LDSYDNTDELIKKYKVLNPTSVYTGVEKKIQNRLLTGFENWNRGFKTWKEWGNILYIPASIYNVHGARLSLASYQNAMDRTLKQTIIYMGDFHNMLITEKYCGIHYDIISNGKRSKVMEFAEFAENAEGGVYVKEGWGSIKDDSYYGLKYFQAESERTFEESQTSELLSYSIPTNDDLKLKYPITNPTSYTAEEEAKLEIILEGFDSWNNGIDAYKAWVDIAYDKDA